MRSVTFNGDDRGIVGKFYPNPTIRATIGIDLYADKAQVSIYSASSKLIQTSKITSGANSISVGDLQKGVYYAVIQSASKAVTRKFILVK